jgi:ribonuclease HII
LALREKNELPDEISAKWHVGVDEAGRGCLAGPVAAAAVLAPPGFDFRSAFPGLTDSKALSPLKRERLRRVILKSALFWGLGFSWPDEIDRINILNATFRAMSRAVCALFSSLERNKPENLPGNSRAVPAIPPLYPAIPPLYIDGAQKIRPAEWQACQKAQYSFILPAQNPLVKGDVLLPSISAASILAKTGRDRLMRALDKLCPGYALALHKGYATKAHLEALARLGPSPLHRKSFAPCAELKQREQGLLV